MKDFDEARDERKSADRAFRFGGETFVMKATVRPEVMVGYESINTDTDALVALSIIDDMVISFIEGGEDAERRYRAVRAREEDAISMDDLNALVEWLISEQTGRPTSAPSASSGGRTTTEDSSTDGPALAVAT